MCECVSEVVKRNIIACDVDIHTHTQTHTQTPSHLRTRIKIKDTTVASCHFFLPFVLLLEYTHLMRRAVLERLVDQKRAGVVRNKQKGAASSSKACKEDFLHLRIFAETRNLIRRGKEEDGEKKEECERRNIPNARKEENVLKVRKAKTSTNDNIQPQNRQRRNKRRCHIDREFNEKIPKNCFYNKNKNVAPLVVVVSCELVQGSSSTI